MISEEILEEYIAYLNEFNFDFKTTNYRYLLKKYLRATMAEQLFGTNAFEKIINQDDAMIEKILELEKNPS